MRFGNFSFVTSRRTAIPRPCARSDRRSAWPRRPPCTRTWPTSNGRECSAATRPSRARSSSWRRTGASPRRSREPDVHRLPLVGQIAAGGPLLAEQNVEEYLAVPEPLARGGRGVPPARPRRVDDQRGDPGRRLRGRAPAAGRGERRDRRRARGRGRGRRRGDRQALLPRERPRPPAARERRARADVPAVRAGARARSSASSGWSRDARSRPLFRTLDQELSALARGASLECLVCGEFVMQCSAASAARNAGRRWARRDPKSAEPGVQLTMQAG